MTFPGIYRCQADDSHEVVTPRRSLGNGRGAQRESSRHVGRRAHVGLAPRARRPCSAAATHHRRLRAAATVTFSRVDWAPAHASVCSTRALNSVVRVSLTAGDWNDPLLSVRTVRKVAKREPRTARRCSSTD